MGGTRVHKRRSHSTKAGSLKQLPVSEDEQRRLLYRELVKENLEQPDDGRREGESSSTASSGRTS